MIKIFVCQFSNMRISHFNYIPFNIALLVNKLDYDGDTLILCIYMRIYKKRRAATLVL